MKKALVTGASSGIGEAVCRKLLEGGYEVFGVGRDFSKCALTAAKDSGEGGACGLFHSISCDLADSDALTGCIRYVNSSHDISLFVSCAGVGYYGLHEELDPAKIHELTAVNLEAPMTITNLLLRDLKKNSGMIVFISSVTASGVNPHGCAYGAVKAGLTSFAHSLFAEGRKYGLKVITVSPDMTKTALYRNADFECADEPGTCLDPEDVAEAVNTAIGLKDGMLYTDITVMPQFHRIKRKNSAQ